MKERWRTDMPKKKQNRDPLALSWKPRRIGPLYCSPACGGRCTWEEHQAALRAAQSLATNLETLTGRRGWKLVIWENLGWHSKAVSPCGRIKVHAHSKSFT